MQRGKMGFWGGGGNGGSTYTQRRGRVYLFSPLLLPHLAGQSVRAHVVVVVAETRKIYRHAQEIFPK